MGPAWERVPGRGNSPGKGLGVKEGTQVGTLDIGSPGGSEPGIHIL